jgi:hypothetical protein
VANDKTIKRKLVFSDEATFHPSRRVTQYNLRVCRGGGGGTHPHETFEHEVLRAVLHFTIETDRNCLARWYPNYVPWNPGVPQEIHGCRKHISFAMQLINIILTIFICIFNLLPISAHEQRLVYFQHKSLVINSVFIHVGKIFSIKVRALRSSIRF